MLPHRVAAEMCAPLPVVHSVAIAVVVCVGDLVEAHCHRHRGWELGKIGRSMALARPKDAKLVPTRTRHDDDA